MNAEKMLSDLTHRFQYHPPSSPLIVSLHTHFRTACGDVAKDAAKKLPNCRELSLAFTALEEAAFWLNAAIARNHSSCIEIDRLNAEAAEKARSAPIAD